jgi:hypothetical protein
LTLFQACCSLSPYRIAPFTFSLGSNGFEISTEENFKRAKFRTEIIDFGSLKLNNE